MSRLVEITSGTSEIVPGFRATVTEIKPFNIGASGLVAKHEAAHATVAFFRNVTTPIVTIKPGPGYLGKAEVSRYDGPTFAAAEAMHFDGISHDMRVVAGHGEDAQSQAEVAKEILEKNPKEFAAVASLIQSRRTITGAEVEWAIDTVRRPQFEVDITNPFGETRQFVTKAKRIGNNILIPTPIYLN